MRTTAIALAAGGLVRRSGPGPGCPATRPPPRPPDRGDRAAPAAPLPDWRALDPDNTLVIDTTKGRVIVELRPDLAPLAVARIKTLTRKGYYDAALFYRVLPFMAQTGDKGSRTFKSDLPNLKAEFTFTRNAAMPFYVVGRLPGGRGRLHRLDAGAGADRRP